MAELDHLMYGAPDLDAGVDAIHALTGVRAVPGGSHPGVGTRNALLGLGRGVYLEIIAPDPSQSLDGNMGGRLQDMSQQGLLTWAARDSGLQRHADTLRSAGMEAMGPIPMTREDPGAGSLAWELLFPQGHSFGLTLPFLIDWLDCPHPSASAPTGCTLKDFRVSTPNAAGFGDVCAKLALKLVPENADAPVLEALLETPNGEVTLRSVVPLPDVML